MKRIRIAQFGLGAIGREMVQFLAGNSRFEMVGAVEADPDLTGQTLGEACDIPELKGAPVFSTFKELWSFVQPEAVFHTVGSKVEETFQEVRPLCEKGLSVVTSCEEMVFPNHRAPESAREIDQLCRQTGARLVGSGVNPGFVLDLLPLFATGATLEVRKIHAERVSNASTRRLPLQRKIGSGLDPILFRERWAHHQVGHAGFQESLLLIAHGMEWSIDYMNEFCNPVIAGQPIETAYFKVPQGMTCGIHQIVEGETADRKSIHLDLKMYLDAPDPHDAFKIEGILPKGLEGDLATVASLINTLSRLLRSSSGLKLLTDLPLSGELL